MNNAKYRETKKNLRNRINVKLVNNKKDYLKVIYFTATWCPSQFKPKKNPKNPP